MDGLWTFLPAILFWVAPISVAAAILAVRDYWREGRNGSERSEDPDSPRFGHQGSR